MKKSDYPTLPKRVFQSPLIEYANFADGSFVTLIRLVKPYANGNAYAVYETTKSTFCSNGLFKTYDQAKAKFELMVKNGSLESELIERNVTTNGIYSSKDDRPFHWTKRNTKTKYLYVKDGERFNISEFPSFHKSGSILGMRKLYYGKDALLVRCGGYIYNVTSKPEIYLAAH